MKLTIKNKFFILTFFLTFFNQSDILYAQNSKTNPNDLSEFNDTLLFNGLKKSKLSFILDDFYIKGGLNYSGIYYSRYFRELNSHLGFNIGIEQYLPLNGKTLLSTGINFSQRNFTHKVIDNQIVFKNNYFDFLASASFELPVLTNFDFRLIIGTMISTRISSSNKVYYSDNYLLNDNNFTYSINDFNRLDFGWFFGLSVEKENFIMKLKSSSGFIKLDKKDQGMLNSFSLELGYFIFRKKN